MMLKAPERTAAVPLKAARKPARTDGPKKPKLPSAPQPRKQSRCYGVRREDWHNRRWTEPTRCPMPKPNDLSRSLTAFEQDSTLIVVIEMSHTSWLVAGIVPGVDREPLKKLEPDGDALLRLLQRWRDEATKAGRMLKRIAVAYEAGRDGFWLARWLRERGVE